MVSFIKRSFSWRTINGGRKKDIGKEYNMAKREREKKTREQERERENIQLVLFVTSNGGN